jgi:hypothetical protein
MKTSELTGAALDWAVAKCEGWVAGTNDDDLVSFVLESSSDEMHFWPSTDWAQGGPIIEREKIGIWFSENAVDDEGSPLRQAKWYAELCSAYTGDTPLEAAMRAYVDTRLGDEVDVPEELLK